MLATRSIRLSRPTFLRSIPISSPQKSNFSFWQWTTQPRPLWYKDPKEGVIACIIFGITGSTSATLARPTVENLFGIHGTLVDGPNSFRVLSLLCISPVYAVLLAIIGTLGGRHVYFAGMSMKILNRFVPKTVLNRVICAPAKRKASQ